MDALMLSEISEPKPLDQEPATTEPDSQIALPQMMPQQRIIELRQRFAKKSVPLPRALTPTLCNIYPDLADEIIGAYLEHTTFVVKVWVNYDAAWKKFFVDGRFHDCGRVIVNAKESLLLQGLAANDVQMTRVRFEIGSAFRPFCDILVRASSDNGELRARCKPRVGNHPELMIVLRDVCAAVENQHLPDGQQGMTVSNIDCMAGWMVRRPEVYDWTYSGNLRVDSPWMDIFREGSMLKWQM